MKKIIADGNEACSYASYMFTEVAGIYPITPSSPMPEIIDKWANNGKKNIFGSPVKVIEMQSEAGAIGLVHGSLQSGMLSSTYTSSQGLLLMIPNMYKIAGEMLPGVIHVASRTIATHALSIFGDHSDVYQTRDTGFCMLSSSNVQDAYYMALVAHLSAIKISLPFLHFFDGFRTSHEIANINIFDKEIDKLVDSSAVEQFRKRALNVHNPVTRGTNQNGDIYFQIMESRNKYYDRAADVVADYMDEINKLAEKDYKPFNYYGFSKATKVIIAMGSVCDTIKEFIQYAGGKVGLVEVHLYRPFSTKYLLNVLPKSVKNIAVLDMAKSAGGNGEPLYLDVLSALKDKNIHIVGGRYGLSSKDTTPGMIKAIYDNMDKLKNEFTVGIEDDVTNLSLPYKNIKTSNALECLIYGYGSDGMVSAAKSIVKIAGQEDKFVQGYFEYDSKKSGGITVSHLRFADNYIRSSYFVTNPKIVVITKDTYLEEFDAISNIGDNGILLINTSIDEKNLLKTLNPYKDILLRKNVRVYTIDASSLAQSIGLGRKISMIMESAILSLMDFVNYERAIKLLEEFITDKFNSRGNKIVEANKLGVNKAREQLKKITLDNQSSILEVKTDNLYETISKRGGNLLKVSDFNEMIDGTAKHNIPVEKPISEVTVKWNKDACIQCGRCSFVCPHGVIRTFLLNEKEYQEAPLEIREKALKALGAEGYYFVIGIAYEKCTGCGVCINSCPGKRGVNALTYGAYINSDNFNWLVSNVSDKDVFKANTIKGTQFKKPKFAFHGACAGCGQTAYIKLLTQMFGSHLIIANATGCSSIYGGSIPSIPYEIPWANSLFEDNAEFGYGILKGYEYGLEQIKNYMKNKNDSLFEMWLNNIDDYEVTKNVYENIDYEKHPFLKQFKNYIVKPSVWLVGGDGWAYDIGFSGIDQVLSSGDDINILVLDSQVYSNTGGQASKATPVGAISKFASTGKKKTKKDLARISMCYPDVYVAQISLGANMMQTIKAFEEAYRHKGPSIIIAYTPCISHGIIEGMGESINMESLATKCGYFPIFRYDGTKFNLDSSADFNLYEDFLKRQTRYASLEKINPDEAERLLSLNKENAIKRYEYYKSLNQ